MIAQVDLCAAAANAAMGLARSVNRLTAPVVGPQIAARTPATRTAIATEAHTAALAVQTMIV